MTSYGSVMLHSNKPLLLLLILFIRLVKAKQLACDFQLVSLIVSQSVSQSVGVSQLFSRYNSRDGKHTFTVVVQLL